MYKTRDWNHYLYTVMIASSPPKVNIVVVHPFFVKEILLELDE
jgi:hypothetical protein